MDLSRHPLDRRLLKLLYESECSRLDLYLEATRREVEHCNTLAKNASLLAIVAAVLDPESDVLPRAVSISGEAFSLLFRSCAGNASGSDLRLDGRPFVVHGQVDESHLHVGNWIDAFFWSILSGDSEKAQWMADYPLSQLLRSSTKQPKVIFEFARVLQLYLRVDESLDAQIDSAIASSKKSPVHSWARNVVRPLLGLLRSVLHDPDEFESRLEDAVAHHKTFWSRTAELRREKSGMVAYELCGIARIAVERGIAFDVTSDYLPMPFVTGRRRSEQGR